MFSKYYSLKKLALTTLALGALVQPVRAYDSKAYPGTMCQRTNAATTAAVRYDPDGAVRNLDPTVAMVVCPIVRDNTDSTGMSYVDVVVNDGSRSSGVTCIVSIRNYKGQALVGQTAHSDIAGISSDPDPTGLNASFVVMHDVQAPTNTGPVYYSLMCSIPGVEAGQVSGIRAYRVQEYPDPPPSD